MNHKMSYLLLINLLLFALQVDAGPNGFDINEPLVPHSDILLGGPPRDGIPAIDKPVFLRAKRAKLATSDEVLGIVVEGVAKAYPIAILNWHEIVNDRLGDEGVVISFCPLCGTGVAFSADVKGEMLSFGVSGLLYNSDVLLYDRKTDSLWSQLLNKAISGPLKGETLQMLPLMHTTWGEWRKQQPNTLVLSRNTGYGADYNRDPYQGYAARPGLYFPVAKRNARYHPKERVIGIELDGQFKAYPMVELAKVGRELKDDFQGRRLLVRYDAANQSASIYDEGDQLMPTVTAFWFAWYAFHPEGAIFTVE
jgi:hypothetical protein